MNLVPAALAVKVVPARLSPMVRHLDRLRTEIAAAHAKGQRLDEFVRELTQNLHRLRAQLAHEVKPGRGIQGRPR